jgi:hypothetical protein
MLAPVASICTGCRLAQSDYADRFVLKGALMFNAWRALCAKCGGTMKVVAFIEPPQGDVIKKILRHCGLWSPVSPAGTCPRWMWHVSSCAHDPLGRFDLAHEHELTS